MNERKENFVSYPRTKHIIGSPGSTNDDRFHSSMSSFESIVEICILEKMDGENLTQYRNGIHCRSLDYSHNLTRDWIRRKHAEISYLIPSFRRICGEYMFAKHSIFYENLRSYFYVFSVWDNDEALSWDETEEVANFLGYPTVKVLYRGPYSEEAVKKVISSMDFEKQEGFVIRPSGRFNFNDFSSVVGKYVRANHVTSSKHWLHEKMIQNLLNGNKNA